MSTGPQVKAADFVSSVRTLRTLAGPEKFAAYVAKLKPETRALVIHLPPASIWIPLEHQINHVLTALDVVYEGNIEPLVVLGRIAFLENIKTIYRVFVRALSPEFVLSRAGRIWSQLYQNNGELLVREMGKGFAVLEIRDNAFAHPAYWKLTLGGIEAVCGVLRLKSPVLAIVEGGKSDAHCTIRATWE